MDEKAPSYTSTYDEIPYPSYVFRESHPDRLACVAHIFGLSSPVLATATILELGCASGANLVPIALSLPRARCVGIDLSSRQIETAKKLAQSAGAKNVQFEVQDLKEVTAGFGKFDYIICHGVYSWVAPELQTKILNICANNLSPNGVAYVSYNTLPGWNMYKTIRDMMLYHTRHLKEPAQIVGQARAFLDFAARAVAHQNNAYSLLLATELRRLQQESDAYLLHDHLEVENNPVYFHDFVASAEAQGLRYLGEAVFHSMALHEFPPQVQQTLRQITDKIVSMEQYADFLRNRTFRSTLLCRKEVKLQRQIEASVLKPFYFGTAFKPLDAKLDPLAPGEATYQQGPSLQVTSADVMTKVMLHCLGEIWPLRVSSGKLVQMLRARLLKVKGADASEDRCMGLALQLAHQGIVEFHMSPPGFTTSISARPAVSALVRAQALEGAEVCNQRHERVVLPALYRFIATLCDGSRDKNALIKGIDELIEQGALMVREGRSIPAPGPERQEYLKKNVEAGLNFFAQTALLVQ